MYKRKIYKTMKTKPIKYNNGFVKKSNNITAYINGNKLICNNCIETDNENWICNFKVTKNSVIIGSAKGIYMPSIKAIQITWKSKKYLISQYKK